MSYFWLQYPHVVIILGDSRINTLFHASKAFLHISPMSEMCLFLSSNYGICYLLREAFLIAGSLFQMVRNYQLCVTFHCLHWCPQDPTLRLFMHTPGMEYQKCAIPSWDQPMPSSSGYTKKIHTPFVFHPKSSFVF